MRTVFKAYPSLTREYEESFKYRYRQFTFPWLTNPKTGHYDKKFNWLNNKEVLEYCYVKNMMPLWVTINYQLEHLEDGVRLALTNIKLAKVCKVQDVVIDNRIARGVVTLLAKFPDPSQLAEEIGAEKVSAIINASYSHGKKQYYVLVDLMQDVTVFMGEFNLEKIQELLETKTIEGILRNITADNRSLVTQPIFKQLVEIFRSRGGDEKLQEIYSVCLFNLFEREQWDELFQLVEQLQVRVYSNGDSFLTRGIALGQYHMLQKALALGVDKNKADKNGKTPLIRAIECAYQAAVELLLREGADPNYGGDNHLPPLHFAQHQMNANSDAMFRIANALLQFGADVNLASTSWPGPEVYPLSFAIQLSASAVRHLILRGADPTVLDEVGNTLLHQLDTHPAAPIPRELLSLLSQRIDINRANKLGITPLHHMIMGKPDSVQVMLDFGADVNRCDMFGRTSLMLAIAHSIEALVPLLKTNALDITARDKRGQSFVEYLADLPRPLKEFSKFIASKLS